MRFHHALIFALALNAWASSVVFQHERLRVKNTFESPEDVVRYYVSRDASGFVWSGLLDIERRAFTTWAEAPQVESFYVASAYEIIRDSGKRAARADVQVKYRGVRGVADAHGTLVPSKESTMTVTFRLEKIEGKWKIVSPAANQITPVVLEDRFPMQTALR